MALSFFDDKSAPPTDDALDAALGATASLWQELKARIGRRHAPVVESWGFSGKSTGWGLRLKRGDRAILYMTPRDGHFLVSFALGEKAVKVARESDLPAAVLDVIERAPKYAEGRGVRLELRDARDLAAIETLAAIKMAS
ncbi:MAG TPA: DUF3788 family protein [Thermoanaerobaculia bacterium]